MLGRLLNLVPVREEAAQVSLVGLRMGEPVFAWGAGPPGTWSLLVCNALPVDYVSGGHVSLQLTCKPRVAAELQCIGTPGQVW